jgi:hypothetical protein
MAKNGKKTGKAQKAAKVKVAVFYGNMDWFSVDVEEPPRSVPRAFTDARKLHETDFKRNEARILELLQPFAHAVFLPTNIADWEDHFVDVGGEGMPEIAASWVRLCGIDFDGAADGPFPLAKMEAEFEVPMSESFDGDTFDGWVEENGVQLYDALSFMWRLPPAKVKGEVELFTWLDNQGAECVRLDRTTANPPKGMK